MNPSAIAQVTRPRSQISEVPPDFFWQSSALTGCNELLSGEICPVGEDPGFWKAGDPAMDDFEMSRQSRRGDAEGVAAWGRVWEGG